MTRVDGRRHRFGRPFAFPLGPLLGLLLVGCGDGCTAPPAARLPVQRTASAPTPEPSVEARYPRVVVEGLPPHSPATQVELAPTGVRVDNTNLLGSWPPDALARARRTPRTDGWPEVSATLPFPGAETGEIPALRTVLSQAREAERDATGSGQGAGTYNLRVEASVPFRALQRVLFTSAMAGYGPPRILLDGDAGARLLAWPTSMPRNAPTPEQIAALLQGTPLPDNPDTPAPPSRPARAELRADGAVIVRLAERIQTAGCTADSEETNPVTLLPDATSATVGRCFDALQPRTDEDAITLSVHSDATFERLSLVLQHAARAFETVRIRRAR